MNVVLLMIAVVVFARRRARRRAVHDRRRVVDELPDTTDLLVAALRAGLTPVQAVRVVAPLVPGSLRPDFDRVLDRLDAGDRFVEAVRGGEHARALFDVLADGERLGVPIDHLAFQLALDARDRRRRGAESDARQLPVRLAVPLVVCTLPSFVVLVIVPVIVDTLGHLGPVT